VFVPDAGRRFGLAAGIETARREVQRSAKTRPPRDPERRSAARRSGYLVDAGHPSCRPNWPPKACPPNVVRAVQQAPPGGRLSRCPTGSRLNVYGPRRGARRWMLNHEQFVAPFPRPYTPTRVGLRSLADAPAAPSRRTVARPRTFEVKRWSQKVVTLPCSRRTAGDSAWPAPRGGPVLVSARSISPQETRRARAEHDLPAKAPQGRPVPPVSCAGAGCRPGAR